MDNTFIDATNHIMVEDNPVTPSSSNVGSPAPSIQSQQSQYKKIHVDQSIVWNKKKRNRSTRRTLKLCAIIAIV
jgi:hypothetical protein